MAKRIFAMILALAMVLSLIPAMVLAEGTQEITELPKAGSHTEAGHSDECTAHCGGNGAWIAWDGDASKLAAGGHYYLTADTTLTAEVTVNADLHLCLNGYVLTAAQDKRIMSTAADAGVTIIISDCTAHTDDGVYTAGKLTGGDSAKDGGAIYLHKTNKLYLYAGILSGNVSAAAGGAIHANAGAEAYLLGGLIEENSSTGNGGAINTGAGTVLTLNGVTIRNNTSNRYGGAAYVNTSAVLTVSGDTVVTGNKRNTTTNNLHLAGSCLMTLEDLGSNADVGITAGARAITGQTTDLSRYFSADGSGYQIIYQDGKLHYALAAQHVHCRCGKTDCTDTTHEKITYMPWEGDASKLAAGGKYYLTKNAQMSAEAVVKADLDLCLCGYTLTAADGSRHMSTADGGNVTITIADCTAKTENGVYTAGKLTGGNSTKDGGAIYLHKSNKLYLYDGILTGNTTSAAGGAIHVHTGAECYLYGGVIENNTATGNGGAINTGAGSVLTLNGVTIKDNTSKRYGGAAYVNTSAVLTISGDTVVTGNKRNTTTNNLHLAGSSLMILKDLGADASVGITAGERAITGETTDLSAHFSADGNDYQVIYQNGKLYYAQAFQHIHCECGKTDCTDATHEKITYLAWTETTSLPSSGNYCLTKDVTISKEVTLKEDLNLCLCGHKVTGTTAKVRFYSTSGSGNEVLTITDCTAKTENGSYTAGGFYNNTNTNTGAAGGAFFIRAGGTLKFYEGIVSGCTALAGGAAIYAKDADLYIYNAQISDNTACDNGTWKNGGAFYLANSRLTIYDGQFTGNEANNGGAIYTTGTCTVDIRGGTFTGNTTHGSSGAINASASCDLKFSGAPVIIGNNLASGKASNVYLSDTGVMDVADLREDAQISVTATAFRAISTETQDYTKNVTSDNAKIKIVYQDNVLYTDAAGDHKHCLCGGSVAAGCDYASVTYIEWDDPTSLPAAGNYYLSVDVAVTKQTSVKNGTLNLCLNGHTIQVDQKDSRIFYLDEGGTLNISDCAGGGKLTGATRAAILANSAGTDMHINLHGGSITGNRNVTSGGGIVIQGGCEFNMYGGSITDNAVESSLILDADGNPVLDEQGNQTYTERNGGGVYVGPGTVFNMYGGEISGNTAKEVNYVKAGGAAAYAGGSGGGAYIRGTANLYGGKITGNTARLGGGALLNGSDAALNIMGTAIEGNTASSGGGVLSQTKSVVNLKSGSVSGNTALGAGGGIYVSTGTTLNMTGGTISGNIASNNGKLKNGGGLYLLASTANISGGTISGNKAANGAGIFMCLSGTRYPTLKLSGDMLITGNTATGAGGGVSITGAGSTITMTGGTISKNIAKNGGGVITQTKSAFTLSGGTISGNTSMSTGGGVYISTNTTFTMTGGAIDSNKATADGGGICLLRSTATFKGGSVSNNTAVNHAGIRISGANITIHNLKLVGNKATGKKTEEGTYTGGNGGGLFAGQVAYTSGGQKLAAIPKVTIYNIYAANNSANNAGGGMLIQSKGTSFTMYGGTFTNNTANGSGGALYLSTNVVAKILGGSFYGNSAKAAGAINFLGCQAELSDVKIYGNTVISQGGACVIGRETAHVTMKNMEIYDNVSDGAAGAILVQSSAVFDLSDSKITGNQCQTSGGAFYFGNPSKANFENVELDGNRSAGIGGACHVHANAILTMTNSTITNNVAEGEYGGGISTRGRTVLSNVKVLNNVATTGNGGGIGTGRANSLMLADEDGLYADNVTISGNQAAGQGGGIYGHRGGPVYLENCTVTDNTAKGEGSGIYSDGRFSLMDSAVTGNTSENSGYAVYMTAAEYDGHSYFTGFKKVGGNVIVRDNEGGNLYIGEGTGVAVVGEGIGEKAHVEVTLHSGVLSEHLFGVYGYEGGDLQYTVTAGDRSVTDPEAYVYYQAPAEEEQTPTTEENNETDEQAPNNGALLYIWAGVSLVLILAVAVIVVLIAKKKKAGSTAKQENKE